MKKTLIIAEAGVNHNGDLKLAKQLIEAGAKAGVDYVKFQTFKASKLVSKSAKKANYQQENLKIKDESQLGMLEKLEINQEAHYILRDHCNQYGVKFLSTGFDIESLEFLNEFGIELFKVPSGEITNLPYLQKIASFNKPIFLSTGMATMKEIKEAFSVFAEAKIDLNKITILHCNTEYPTPMIDVNLLAMKTIRKELNVSVGYSDHTLGVEVPIAAVALGATVIEKHFTLDRNMKGPDHKASLEPLELKLMVDSIRNIEMALGDGVKQPSNSEKKNIPVARKSIVAARDIVKGEFLNKKNLTVKRPGDGISPMLWDQIIGTKARKDYKEDDLI